MGRKLKRDKTGGEHRRDVSLTPEGKASGGPRAEGGNASATKGALRLGKKRGDGVG